MSDEKRRAGGAIRIPFVRRCTLELGGGAELIAFLVNINVLGAYIASDTPPPLGLTVRCRFPVPDSEREAVIEGVVAWTNPQQQHPVHSLPAGFGLSFRSLSEENRARIESIVRDYLVRQAG